MIPPSRIQRKEIIEELSNAYENSEVERTLGGDGSIKFIDESKIATRFYLQKCNSLLSMELISYYAQTL
ncbi:MAG: hypothetical protein WAZ77_22610 [Candidatus Nitrosopolaris sp.]